LIKHPKSPDLEARHIGHTPPSKLPTSSDFPINTISARQAHKALEIPSHRLLTANQKKYVQTTGKTTTPNQKLLSPRSRHPASSGKSLQNN
jgi:hypothetical protein